MKNRRLLVIVFVLVVIGGLTLFGGTDNNGGEEADLQVDSQVGLKEYATSLRYEEDMTFDGDLDIPSDQGVILVGGSSVIIEGNLLLAGGFLCEDGEIKIIVKGDAFIDGTLECDRTLEIPETDPGNGITVIVEGNVTLGENALVTSNSAIQIVDREESLAISRAELDQLYEDAASESGEGQRVGPFIDNEGVARARIWGVASLKGVLSSVLPSDFMSTVYAQGVGPVISGKIRFKNPPPKGVKQIVVFAFPNAPGVQIKNFELSGPPGRNGTDDTGGNCNALGTDGEDAFRFLAFAPNITVNNFTLNLGDGGNGGDAETGKNCDPGIAKAGKGGGSGNFKMVAGNKFEITGAFNINPGTSGFGGGATAHGKDGGPGEDGGDARATGGRGADNKKRLSVQGTIAGTSNVEVGDLVAGAGGFASANPGTGGDGEGCGDKGGNGGKASATAGDGGDAKLTLGGGARRAALASDIGGQGATADATGAKGGAGGSCDATDPGGDGGAGGEASAKEGKGGSGSAGNSGDGIVLDETGGDGGNGGDGCLPGKSGAGGQGDPDGEDGKDGKNLCALPPQESTYIAPPPEETISVIQYGNFYLPVDQLIVESERGCDGGAAHWHASGGVVIATDGTDVFDPGPECGYGKVSENPKMELKI